MSTEELTKQYNELVLKMQKSFARNKAWWPWMTVLIVNFVLSVIVSMTASGPWVPVWFYLGYSLWSVVAYVAMSIFLSKWFKGWSWIVAIFACGALFVLNAIMTFLAYLLISNESTYGFVLLFIGACALSPLPMYYLYYVNGMKSFKMSFTLEQFLAAAQKLAEDNEKERSEWHDDEAEANRNEAVFEALKALVPEDKMAEINKKFPLWKELETKPAASEPFAPSLYEILITIHEMKPKKEVTPAE